MVAVLVIATLIDLTLAALLVAVSGFILEGVNNTGPEMPTAVLLVGFVVFAVAAPVIAWTMHFRAVNRRLAVALALAPAAVAGLTLLLEPVFAG